MELKEFKKMSEIEITIRKIEDIKMVHIYELTGGNLKDGFAGLVAIAVTYGDNQQLNLSESDEGFQSLVNRVYSLYEKDKNIMMDETTRSLLDGGLVVRGEQSLQDYYELEALEQPLLSLDSDLSKRFLPIVEYLAESLYSLFDIKLQIVKRKPGWRGAILLETEVAGAAKIMYAKVSRINETRYAISITNFIKDSSTLLVNVKVGFGRFEILFEAEDLMLEGTFTYDFNGNVLRESKEILQAGKSIYYDVSEKEANDSSFEFPFGMTYSANIISNVTGDIKTDEYQECYIWSSGDYVEYKGWSEVQNLAKEIRLKIHNISYQKIKLTDGRWQVYFLETNGNTSEKYRNKLQGKYYLG